MTNLGDSSEFRTEETKKTAKTVGEAKGERWELVFRMKRAQGIYETERKE